MPSVRPRCKGSLALQTACGRCDGCVADAEAIIKRLCRVPFAQIPTADKALLSEACAVILAMRGQRAFQAIVSEGVNEVCRPSCPRCGSTALDSGALIDLAANVRVCQGCGWMGDETKLVPMVISEGRRS